MHTQALYTNLQIHILYTHIIQGTHIHTYNFFGLQLLVVVRIHIHIDYKLVFFNPNY